MKKIILAISIIFSLVGCKNETTSVVKNENSDTSYAVFGDSISSNEAISYQEMNSKFENLAEGDTLNISFKSSINDVCQTKGCWMNVALDDKNETFVKFKDYAFFVPMNAKDKEVIVSGKAYVSLESIEDLKHYAQDAGKSQAAIDSITEPKKKYLFMADGVLIKK